MPYRRRYTRRISRRRRTRTPWYNRRYTALQVAKSALRATKYIRGLVNSEMFHLDQQLMLGNNKSYVHFIPSLAQGDTMTGRTGNSILAKSLAMNGYMIINPSVSSNTRVSLILFTDKQQVADSSVAITTLLASNEPHSLLNTETLGRFNIIWRKDYVLQPASSGKDTFNIKRFTPLNFHIRYNGTGSADIQKNGLYLAMVTSESTNFPSIEINTRLNYHDN